MSDAEEEKKVAVEAKADWNEEFDAWLELIEDHLKAIRRGQIVMIVVLLLLIITTIAAYWPYIAFLLHVRIPSAY